MWQCTLLTLALKRKRQGDVCEFPLAQTRYQLPGQTEIQSETPIKDKQINTKQQESLSFNCKLNKVNAMEVSGNLRDLYKKDSKWLISTNTKLSRIPKFCLDLVLQKQRYSWKIQKRCYIICLAGSKTSEIILAM